MMTFLLLFIRVNTLGHLTLSLTLSYSYLFSFFSAFISSIGSYLFSSLCEKTYLSRNEMMLKKILVSILINAMKEEMLALA